MGCGASTVIVPPRQLVLLGGGECGKTTIFKQMQILYGVGFEAVAMEWIDACHRSPMRTVKSLLMALQNKVDTYTLLESNQEVAQRCLTNHQETGMLSASAAADIQLIWGDPAVQSLIANETDLDLDDNAKYFMGKLEEMATDGYKPSTEDILKVRDPTRTIETLDFKYQKAPIRVIDVGGQRMERPKWNLTGDITAVIFVCSLTEYNQVLREDVKQNRLKESLNLFDIACNRRYPDKPIILFLNKVDLFKEKIRDVDLSVCFPQYKGGCNYDNALDYIKTKFKLIRKDKAKEIYVYETTATDSSNMEKIIGAMMDIVEKENLRVAGLS